MPLQLTLAACLQASAFPRLEVVLSDGTPATFPPAAAAALSSSSGSSEASSSSSSAAAEPPAAASLVCVAFRAGAQPMLEAWAGPFAQHFQGRSGVALYELAIVEGVVSWCRAASLWWLSLDLHGQTWR